MRLNNEVIENKIYIFEKYKDEEERKKLLEMVDDKYSNDCTKYK